MGNPQFVYLMAQVLLAIFNWLILTLLAKNFDKALLGEYSLVLAWLAPIFLLYSLQIKSRFLTSSKYSIKQFSSLRVILIFPLIIICSLTFFFELNRYLLCGVFLLKLSELIFELPFMLEQKTDKLMAGSLKQIGRAAVIYSCLILISLQVKDFQFALIISALVSMAISIAYLVFKKIKILPKLDKFLFKELLPLGLSSFLLSFTISLPRFYLKAYLTLEDVALYTVVFSFYAIWQLLFNNYFTGILNKIKNISLKRYIVLPLGVYFVCSTIFCVLDEEVYQFLFGENFVIASQYTTVLLVNILISFFNSALYYKLLSHQNYESHLRINVLTFLFSVLCLLLTIQSMGIMGAFVGQGIVQLFQMILYKRALR